MASRPKSTAKKTKKKVTKKQPAAGTLKKIEIKDIKEPKEHKEIKEPKELKEIKEHKEKEPKELKEHKEKIEVKEHKPEIKEAKIELKEHTKIEIKEHTKIEAKEHLKDTKPEFEKIQPENPKELVETGPITNPIDPVAVGDLAHRIANIEGQLATFISKANRPDLRAGALKNEAAKQRKK